MRARIVAVLSVGVPWLWVEGWEYVASWGLWSWAGWVLGLLLALYGFVRWSIRTALTWPDES